MDIHEDRNFECPSCYTIVSKGELYRPDTITVFTIMGKALGDSVYSNFLKRMYLQFNPKETVYFLTERMTVEGIKQLLNPDKIFWSDVQDGESKGTPKGVYWFSLTNEVKAYNKMGYYPELWFKPLDVKFKPKKRIILHPRNVDNDTSFKNMNFEVFKELLRYLKEYDIVLIGNDEKFKHENIGLTNIIDYRNKLSLSQIVDLINDSTLYLGVDSGLAHIAGCCNTKMIVWDFRNFNWFPITRNKHKYLQLKDSTIDNIIKNIQEILNGNR